MSRSGPASRENSLLPMSDAREAALFFVVAALCFLAALAALSARASYGAAAGWTAEVEGELTVRLRGADARAARDAEALLASMDEVNEAQLISRDEAAQLLSPWFGTEGLPAGLPLPVLIEIQAAQGAQQVATRLEQQLTEAGFTATVDDHSSWTGDLRRTLGLARLVALATVALLGATAIAVIAFATHAALLARRDIVDVLHLTGAEDPFIAGLFERRFWLLGLHAGSIGALAALGMTAFLIAAAGTSADRSLVHAAVQPRCVGLCYLACDPSHRRRRSPLRRQTNCDQYTRKDNLGDLVGEVLFAADEKASMTPSVPHDRMRTDGRPAA